jgi:hypothetical protein
VTTVKLVMGRIISKVRSWQFSRRLAKAERRHESTQIIANNAEQTWNAGMTAVLGLWNSNRRTPEDWTK